MSVSLSQLRAAALRRPMPALPQPDPMSQSVMSQPSQPEPVLNEDLPIEPVSPEDWIPNPKSIAALGGKALSGMGAAGMLMGPNSKLWRQGDALTAWKRLKGGDKPAQVWHDTGSGRFPSGDIAQESSDAAGNYRPGGAYKRWAKQVGVTPETDIERKTFSGYLPDIYNDPQLYAAYPELRKKSFEVVDKSVLGNGWGDNRKYGPLRIRADIAHKDLDEGKKVFLHEAKHEVENIEGWPTGGHPQYVKELLSPQEDLLAAQLLRGKNINAPTSPYGRMTFDDMKVALDDYNKTHGASDSDYEKLYNIAIALRDRQRASNEVAYKSYQDLEGEAMARLMEHRRNLTPDEIRQQYPFDPDYFNKATGSDINNLRVTY